MSQSILGKALLVLLCQKSTCINEGEPKEIAENQDIDLIKPNHIKHGLICTARFWENLESSNRLEIPV